MSLVIFRNRFAPFKHSHRLCLLAIALGTLQNCSPAPQKKTDNPTPEPSLSTKKTAQESIDQLEIMSTPPQEWRLEIKEGQKDLSSQQYQFKELQWKSKAWQFKSPAAVQEAQHNDSFLFDTIYGTTIPERIALIAHQTTFNSAEGLINGHELVIKSQNAHWEITAKSYKSNYPWSTFKLQNVKGTFQR